MTTRTGDLSIGIAAAAGADVARAIAPRMQHAGMRALWVNDTPSFDALAVLAAAAEAADRLILATGVVPVDRRDAEAIVSRVEELDLPRERLVLGIGSGQRRTGALAGVRDAAETIRAGLGVEVIVGALGPRMRRLGAEAADGVLLSWLTPEAARRQAAEAHAVSPRAHVALYARAAVEQAAVARLEAETARYASFPAYAANLAREGIEAADTVLRPDAVAAGIRRYLPCVDELVLRAMVPAEDPDDYVRFVDAVATDAP